MKPIIITGTNTDIGKTIVAAMLTAAFECFYIKPIQSGGEQDNDTERVKQLTGLEDKHFYQEIYSFKAPLSPHRAAELEERRIDENNLQLPVNANSDNLLIVEGAGGVLVPVNRNCLYIDVFKSWQAPVIICASTKLGTINHSLLTVEALKHRAIPILGIIFIGDENLDTEKTILEFSGVKRLGRLPWLNLTDKHSLIEAFQQNFSAADFLEV